jgi:nucleoside-diphosphate-sugar epimerase
MSSDFVGPLNIGSEEMVTINELSDMVVMISGKQVSYNHITGPLGVRGRNSDNKLIKEKLSWEPNYPLYNGLQITYKWIEGELQKAIKGNNK